MSNRNTTNNPYYDVLELLKEELQDRIYNYRINMYDQNMIIRFRECNSILEFIDEKLNMID